MRGFLLLQEIPDFRAEELTNSLLKDPVLILNMMFSLTLALFQLHRSITIHNTLHYMRTSFIMMCKLCETGTPGGDTERTNKNVKEKGEAHKRKTHFFHAARTSLSKDVLLDVSSVTAVDCFLAGAFFCCCSG